MVAVLVMRLFFAIGLLLLAACSEAKPPQCPECKVSTTGIALIRQYEGLSLTCYQDVAGYWTIGWGHLLDGKDDCPGKLTLKEADALFMQDVAEAEETVRALVTVPLTQGQYDSLVSFAFNLGYGNLRDSTLLALVNAGKHEAAQAEFSRWVYAGGEKVVGLRIRRGIEAFVYGNV